MRRPLEPRACPAGSIAIHAAYIEAGSDAIITNSFGANRWVLGRYGLADRVVAAVNRAAARLRAGEAAGADRVRARRHRPVRRVPPAARRRRPRTSSRPSSPRPGRRAARGRRRRRSSSRR
ncbi:MAG: homocysteine S-methyltransferase family protein [Ignavibacteriales bacterium]|nr:homocysteine S-methyltransferase family protein [Ignavibacteriales bacterium]